MYDFLLFVHVLSAFLLVATVVMLSAFALGWTSDRWVLLVGSVLWAIGGFGTLIFGVWLALYVSGYEIWDGWIIAALVLWMIATELGRRAELGYRERAGAVGGAVASGAASQASLFHWLRAVVVLALLVVMIYKPGA